MVIPPKKEIEELEETIKKTLGFEGKVIVDVRPYLFHDLGYKLATDLSKLEVSIYSARYPFSFLQWKDFFYEEVKNKIQLLRNKEEMIS